MLGGGGVARRRPDLEPLGRRTEPLGGRSGEEVRLPGRRAHAEHGGQAGRRELVVQLELLPGHMEEPAEVDVVRPRRQGTPHHVEVQPVVEAVHADVGAHEAVAERLRITGVEEFLVREAKVSPGDGRPPLLQEPRHVAADRAGASEHRNHAPFPPAAPSAPDLT